MTRFLNHLRLLFPQTCPVPITWWQLGYPEQQEGFKKRCYFHLTFVKPPLLLLHKRYNEPKMLLYARQISRIPKPKALQKILCIFVCLGDFLVTHDQQHLFWNLSSLAGVKAPCCQTSLRPSAWMEIRLLGVAFVKIGFCLESGFHAAVPHIIKT